MKKKNFIQRQGFQEVRGALALSAQTGVLFLGCLISLTACGEGESSEVSAVAFEAGTDPFYGQQWYIVNSGQKAFSNSAGLAGEDIHLGQVHTNGIFGNGIRIAVSDTGVQGDHEDLRDRMLTEEARDYSLVNPSSGSASPDLESDESWTAHGTAVAGLIAATGWNGFGIRGVAPKASIASLKFIGVNTTLSDVLDQASGELDIYNYSYGFQTCEITPMEPGLHEALIAGADTGRAGKGALYVKAAGNEFEGDLGSCLPSTGAGLSFFGNSNFDQSNTVPEVIVVGAVNALGVKSSYSSPGSNLWISAPGGEYGVSSPALITTDLSSCVYGFSSLWSYTAFDAGALGNGECNYTNSMNGTSSATPLVAGTIALLLEANPDLNWREIKRILARTARKVESSASTTAHPLASLSLSNHDYQRGWVTNSAGHSFHNYYGFGVIDAEAAVASALAMIQTGGAGLGPQVTRSASQTATGVIPDRSAIGVSQSLTVADSLQIESVVVKVNITHTFASDLGIELTSPSGTQSILMNINSGIIDESLSETRFMSNAFLDEDAQGVWSIRVVDGLSQDTGTLDSWTLEVSGHLPE